MLMLFIMYTITGFKKMEFFASAPLLERRARLIQIFIALKKAQIMFFIYAHRQMAARAFSIVLQ